MQPGLARWIEEIAPMPTACSEVLALTQDGDAPLARVAAIIEADVRMSLQVLRVANSPIMARRYPAVTVREAVVTIGAEETARIAVGCALLMDLGPGNADLPVDAVLEHGLQVAKAWNAFGHAEATTGVLLNGPLLVIGRDATAFGAYSRAVEKTAGPDELHELEKQVWGATRCEIADRLAEAWRLPPAIGDVLSGWHACRGLLPGLYESFGKVTRGSENSLIRSFAGR